MRTLRRNPSLDSLRSVDQFRKCTKAQLRGVERLAEHVKVNRGEVLVREGHADRELFLILAGTVEVTQAGQRVNTLGPCDFFGELAALNRGLRNATVTALSDLELLIIGPRELDAMAQIPGFRDALLTEDGQPLARCRCPARRSRRRRCQFRNADRDRNSLAPSESIKKRSRRDSNLPIGSRGHSNGHSRDARCQPTAARTLPPDAVGALALSRPRCRTVSMIAT